LFEAARRQRKAESDYQPQERQGRAGYHIQVTPLVFLKRAELAADVHTELNR
jgi:hypothetical protein